MEGRSATDCVFYRLFGRNSAGYLLGSSTPSTAERVEDGGKLDTVFILFHIECEASHVRANVDVNAVASSIIHSIDG